MTPDFLISESEFFLDSTWPYATRRIQTTPKKFSASMRWPKISDKKFNKHLQANIKLEKNTIITVVYNALDYQNLLLNCF